MVNGGPYLHPGKQRGSRLRGRTRSGLDAGSARMGLPFLDRQTSYLLLFLFKKTHLEESDRFLERKAGMTALNENQFSLSTHGR